MNPISLQFHLFPSFLLKKTLIIPFIFLFFNPIWSQTIVGAVYMMPNTEGVYSLSPANKGTWDVLKNGVLTESHFNVGSIKIQSLDICNSSVSLKVTTSSGRIIRKTIIVRDLVPPMIDEGFETATLSCNNLDGFPPTGMDNSGKPVTVRLRSFANVQGQCLMNLTWEVVDFCGNAKTLVQAVTPSTTDDNEPPVMSFQKSVTYACDAVPPLFPTPTATDNCSNLVEVRLAKKTSNYAYVPFCKTYDLYLTWEAIDACGNKSSEVQTIHIEDKIPPVFNTDTLKYLSGCSPNDIPYYRPYVKDNCSDPLTVNLVKRTYEPFTCGYKVWDTWEAIDACGNTSTSVQAFEIEDKTPPQFMMPATLCMACNMIPAVLPQPVVVDACDPVPHVRLLHESPPMGCIGSQYYITRFWSAVDACGNYSTFEQRISVQASCPVMPPPMGGGDLVHQIEKGQSAVSSVSVKNLQRNLVENSDNKVGEIQVNPSILKTSTVIQLQAYPNPTNGRVHFTLNAPQVGDAVLSLFDATGRQIGSIKQVYNDARKDVLLPYDIPSTTSAGLIFYKMTVGNSVVSGKINYVK
jgi:hypothetical protein